MQNTFSFRGYSYTVLSTSYWRTRNHPNNNVHGVYQLISYWCNILASLLQTRKHCCNPRWVQCSVTPRRLTFFSTQYMYYNYFCSLEAFPVSWLATSSSRRKRQLFLSCTLSFIGIYHAVSAVTKWRTDPVNMRPGFSKFLNFNRQCAKLWPILYGDVSVVIHYCAGKILVRQYGTPVDGYVHLNKCLGWSVHSFITFCSKTAWHGIAYMYLYQE